MNTNPSCIAPIDSDSRIHKPSAVAALERAKAANASRKYELRIDERTKIMVTRNNFSRAYAEAYKARLDKR